MNDQTMFHHSSYFISSMAITIIGYIIIYISDNKLFDLQVCITHLLLSGCFLHLQQPNGIFLMASTVSLEGVKTSK